MSTAEVPTGFDALPVIAASVVRAVDLGGLYVLVVIAAALVAAVWLGRRLPDR